MAEKRFQAKVTVELTLRQAQFLWRLMCNLDDCSEDASVRRDSRRIIAKLSRDPDWELPHA